MKKLVFTLVFIGFSLFAGDYIYKFKRDGTPIARTETATGKVEIFSDLHETIEQITIKHDSLKRLDANFAALYPDRNITDVKLKASLVAQKLPEFVSSEFIDALVQVHASASESIEIEAHVVEKGILHWIEINKHNRLKKLYQAQH